VQNNLVLNFNTLNNIVDEINNHQSGVKRVFINNSQTNSALTQLAYGFMGPGELSGLHTHKTMDEYFFFIKGTGVCILDQKEIQITPSSFLRIPATTPHNLIQTGHQTLEFVYFGVAIEL